jgi:hypothetical protein
MMKAKARGKVDGKVERKQALEDAPRISQGSFTNDLSI